MLSRYMPLSVAQHSLLVLVLRQGMQPHQPLAPREALRELLHDAEELSSLCGGILQAPRLLASRVGRT